MIAWTWGEASGFINPFTPASPFLGELCFGMQMGQQVEEECAFFQRFGKTPGWLLGELEPLPQSPSSEMGTLFLQERFNSSYALISTASVCRWETEAQSKDSLRSPACL